MTLSQKEPKPPRQRQAEPQLDRPDLEELRRLAVQATPGPWQQVSTSDRNDKWTISAPTVRQHLLDSLFVGGRVRSEADAAYIAAASPDVILALLSERQENQDRIAELTRELAAEGSHAIRVYRQSRHGDPEKRIAALERAWDHIETGILMTRPGLPPRMTDLMRIFNEARSLLSSSGGDE